MKISTSHKGFTIIELLVVIAIIAILSGIIITALTGSKAKSRDAERVSDLNQIQLALEQYFDRCGQYPAVDANGGPSTTSSCTSGGTTVNINSYISVIPADPSSKRNYDYVINNGTTPTDYILHTTLESTNAAQQNSYSESSRQNFVTANTPPNATPPNSMSPSSISWKCFNPSNSSADYNYCISTH